MWSELNGNKDVNTLADSAICMLSIINNDIKFIKQFREGVWAQKPNASLPLGQAALKFYLSWASLGLLF